MKIVHGKPRHSQSQGSVEAANKDIERILTSVQRDRNDVKWSTYLPNIQFMKNNARQRTIGMSPYEAMFGHPPRTGLSANFIPQEIRDKIHDEEDLEAVLNTTAINDFTSNRPAPSIQSVITADDDEIDVDDLIQTMEQFESDVRNDPPLQQEMTLQTHIDQNEDEIMNENDIPNNAILQTQEITVEIHETEEDEITNENHIQNHPLLQTQELTAETHETDKDEIMSDNEATSNHPIPQQEIVALQIQDTENGKQVDLNFIIFFSRGQKWEHFFDVLLGLPLIFCMF